MISFPHTLRDRKAPMAGDVHIGFMTDANVQDFDDIEAFLKGIAMMKLLYNANPQLRVNVHVILDCEKRMQFLKIVLDAFAKLQQDTFHVPNSNLKFVVYKFEVRDDGRIAEIKKEMDDALRSSPDFQDSPIMMRHSTEYPWSYLHALVVAGPLHGVPMANVKYMPSASVVVMVGDKAGVNGRPLHLFEEMQNACKLKNNGKHDSEDIDIVSRLILVPPVDPHGNAGFTRQALVDVMYMEVFCVLFEKTKQPAFKIMAEGLAKSTSRTFTDRLDNDRSAEIRRRITNSNWLTLEKMLEKLKAGSELTITLFNQITQENVVFQTKCDEVQKIQATAITLLGYMKSGFIVLVDSNVKLYSTPLPTLNLTALFQSYCSRVGIEQKSMQHAAHQEKIAIICCVLCTMAVFGNIFAPSPRICIAPEHTTAVISEIISGCTKCNPQGQLTKLTPNYDGAVFEAVIMHCLQIVSLFNYNIEELDGHNVICNQNERVIEAYEARENEQLKHILELFVQFQSPHVFKRTESMVTESMVTESMTVLESESIEAPVYAEVCANVHNNAHSISTEHDVPVNVEVK